MTGGGVSYREALSPSPIGNARWYRLDANIRFDGGSLVIGVRYAWTQYDAATMDALLSAIAASLRGIGRGESVSTERGE